MLGGGAVLLKMTRGRTGQPRSSDSPTERRVTELEKICKKLSMYIAECLGGGAFLFKMT